MHCSKYVINASPASVAAPPLPLSLFLLLLLHVLRIEPPVRRPHSLVRSHPVSYAPVFIIPVPAGRAAVVMFTVQGEVRALVAAPGKGCFQIFFF